MSTTAHDNRTVAPSWVRVVAEREIRTRIRDKSFLAATGVTLAIIIGLLVFSAILGSQSDEYDVAVGPGVADTTTELAQEVLVASGSEDAVVTSSSHDSPEAVEQAVREGDADAGVVLADGTHTLVGDDEIDGALRSALTAAIGETVLQANAAEADVDLDALRAGTAPEVRLLDPNADESDARSGVAFAFVIVFFITALSFGMTIAQSVVQEKESRVVEILAAAVPIRSLLWGKILGNTVLALGQVLLLSIVGVAGLLLTGQRDLVQGVGWSLVAYLGFFVLGFLTLACLWSVAGAIAGRQEDLQSTTLPGQMILMVPYFIAVLGGEQVRTIFSMLPIVSTMIMPGRLAEGSVPWWQVGVAVAVTLVAAAVFVRVGTRLYERTLLRTGSKLSYRQAMTVSDA
jgi:ABC-2 type transport system permease protein